MAGMMPGLGLPGGMPGFFDLLGVQVVRFRGLGLRAA